MEKKHELPEFQVILQNQANAKFFVASSFDSVPTPTSNTRSDARYNYTSGDESEGGNDSVW